MFRWTTVNRAYPKSHQDKAITNPLRRWVAAKLAVGVTVLGMSTVPLSYYYHSNQDPGEVPLIPMEEAERKKLMMKPGQIEEKKVQFASTGMVSLVEVLPWNFASRYLGSVAGNEGLPKWFHQFLIRTLITVYDIKKLDPETGLPKSGSGTGNLLSETGEEDKARLESYNTVQDFFIRARDAPPKVDSTCGVVSPCDASVVQLGKMVDHGKGAGLDKLVQAKGATYSLTNLLRTSAIPPPKEGHTRWFWTLYLAPGAYHRFHSPAEDFKVTSSVYVPGNLLPIAPGMAKWIPNIYVSNERVNVVGSYSVKDSWIKEIKKKGKEQQVVAEAPTPSTEKVKVTGQSNYSKKGGSFFSSKEKKKSSSSETVESSAPFMAMSMIGAANVGCIQLDIDQRIQTNPDVSFGDFGVKREYKKNIPLLPKGDEIGRFKLGSCIVVVADVPTEVGLPKSKVGDQVQVGEALF